VKLGERKMLSQYTFPPRAYNEKLLVIVISIYGYTMPTEGKSSVLPANSGLLGLPVEHLLHLSSELGRQHSYRSKSCI
jgi:hypothetical protein